MHRRHSLVLSIKAALLTPTATALLLWGCNWSPSRPFERNAPEVDNAIRALDAGDANAAADLLEQYLSTGKCADGSIGLPDRVRDKQGASFDLGLSLFHLSERYGKRFGEEEQTADGGVDPEAQTEAQLRSDQVDCALKIVKAIAMSPSTPVDLAARAHYLAGNLEFLRRGYQAAVASYDEALRMIPGLGDDAGDGVGRDAAWNRSIALRRIEDEKNRDAGQDAKEDAQDAQNDSQDASNDQDAGPDSPPDAPEDSKNDSGQPDASGDANDSGQNSKDSGSDSGQDAQDQQDQTPDAGGPDGGSPPPPQNSSQDERMLDMLESAPTVQQQDAKNRAMRRRVRGMVDK